MLKVVEIFSSICGEGQNVGRPAVFFRVGSCNINCDFCDTPYKDNYTRMSIKEARKVLFKGFKETDLQHLVITGGEPSLQAEDLTKMLNRKILGRLRSIGIETNGLKGFECWEDLINKSIKFGTVVYICCSPKFNQALYQRKSKSIRYIFYKLIIEDVDDVKKYLYLIGEKFSEDMSDNFKYNRVFLQPKDNNFDIARDLILNKCYGCRLSMQLHKILEVQ